MNGNLHVAATTILQNSGPGRTDPSCPGRDGPVANRDI